MQSKRAYIGLGGNMGDRLSMLNKAFASIGALDKVSNPKCSHIYETTPVSPIQQGNYYNAVCCFDTTYSAPDLQAALQAIERQLGKQPKSKDAPRLIDLDILFFANEWIDTPDLQVPHPRWKERLFVLKPLSELITHLSIPVAPRKTIDLKLPDLLDNFSNPHQETVRIVD